MVCASWLNLPKNPLKQKKKKSAPFFLLTLNIIYALINAHMMYLCITCLKILFIH